MSSRVIKKLGLRKNDIPVVANVESEDSSSEPDQYWRLHNRFGVLNVGSDSEPEGNNNKQEDAVINDEPVAKNKGNRQRRKRPKRRPKVKVVPKLKRGIDGAEFDFKKKPYHDYAWDVYEYRRTEEEMNQLLTLHKNEKLKVLVTPHENLNDENELKRRFGQNVIQEIVRERKLRRYKRAYVLVAENPNWPPETKGGGIEMKFLKNENGIRYFKFEWSLSYRERQRRFVRIAVDYFNISQLQPFLSVYPYHASALVYLSIWLRRAEEYPMCADVIARALYFLEMNFHNKFHIGDPSCRLEYKFVENRALFLALFGHMLATAQRGCHCTAFELNKTLLALDPEQDPLASILSIDLFALRAKKYQWLLDFIKQWDLEKALMKLPNFRYSKALAMFYLSDPNADYALEDAILSFPIVFAQLVEKCHFKVNAAIKSHPLFDQESRLNAADKAPLRALVKLYTNCIGNEWKEKGIGEWMNRVATSALKREGKMHGFKGIRRGWYPGNIIPPAIRKHIILRGFPDLLPTGTLRFIYPDDSPPSLQENPPPLPAAAPSAGPSSAGAPSAGAPSAGAPSAGPSSAGPSSAGPSSVGAPSAGVSSTGASSRGAPSVGAPSASAREFFRTLLPSTSFEISQNQNSGNSSAEASSDVHSGTERTLRSGVRSLLNTLRTFIGPPDTSGVNTEPGTGESVVVDADPNPTNTEHISNEQTRRDNKNVSNECTNCDDTEEANNDSSHDENDELIPTDNEDTSSERIPTDNEDISNEHSPADSDDCEETNGDSNESDDCEEANSDGNESDDCEEANGDGNDEDDTEDITDSGSGDTDNSECSSDEEEEGERPAAM